MPPVTIDIIDQKIAELRAQIKILEEARSMCAPGRASRPPRMGEIDARLVRAGKPRGRPSRRKATGQGGKTGKAAQRAPKAPTKGPRRGTIAARILAAIKGGATSSKKLLVKMGAKSDKDIMSVRNAIASLKSQGRIKSPSRGVYALG